MMGGWGYGPYSMHGGMFGFGTTGWIGLGVQLLFWLGLIALVVMLFRRNRNHLPTNSRGYYPRDNKAMDILRERYAKGEIDADEFQRRKIDLES